MKIFILKKNYNFFKEVEFNTPSGISFKSKLLIFLYIMIKNVNELIKIISLIIYNFTILLILKKLEKI